MLAPLALETYGTLSTLVTRTCATSCATTCGRGDVARRTCGQGSQVRRPRWALLHFLRRLREPISVTLQRGNAAFIRKWLVYSVPAGAAAQGGPDAGGADAAALEGA